MKKSNENKNARFSVYVNGGDVIITLKPKQVLNWGMSEPTDEGYHYENFTWELHNGTVYCEMSSGGRDCDGRIDHYTDRECKVENIDLEKYAPWEKQNHSVQDHNAIAANY